MSKKDAVYSAGIEILYAVNRRLDELFCEN